MNLKQYKDQQIVNDLIIYKKKYGMKEVLKLLGEADRQIKALEDGTYPKND